MINLDFRFPYPGARMPVMARNIVATSQPLAVQAGIAALRGGGNAVDAALAAAITLTVVEPTSNGIGSDAFCVLWDGEKLHGLNASGRSPAAVTATDFDGRSEMPLRGWDSVTVPGAVSAWVALSKRFGKLPFARLFDDAIRHAHDGFAVSPVTAEAWSDAPEIFSDFSDFAPFLPDGRTPEAGQRFRFPEQADTLQAIAASDGEAFYRGALADKIIAAADNAGAKFSHADLAEHRCDWVDTISNRYASHHCGAVELHEIPPNGQGLAALIMLGIVEQHGIRQYEINSADFFHLQIEAMKLAFADAHRYIADHAHLEFPVRRLLEPDYLAQRVALIDMTRAGNPDYGVPSHGGTVYLTSADQNGMMVSFIQSNFWGFGSGIVIPGTGISLQNRAAGFNLTRGHPNCISGGARPFHTILPGFLMRDEQPLMSFGVMGGPMQPQGHAQMVIRICDYAQNPQSASDAPRWQVMDGNRVALEPGVADDVKNELANRGHRLHDDKAHGIFSMGGAQLIYATADGYIAGSDHRKDGMAAGF